MTLRRWSVELALAAWVCTLVSAGAALAQPGVVVSRNEARARFADELSFALEARSEVPIREAVLRYQTDVDGPVNRRIPRFQPGRELRASVVEPLERGEIAPAATVKWWWTLVDDAGRMIDTAPREITYLDEGFDWLRLESGDVRVWTYDGAAGRAEELATQAREALDRLEELVGSRPDRPVNIVAYRSRADMADALVSHGEVYESQLTTLGARVAPDILVVLAEDQAQARREVLAHELSHVVLDMHFAESFVDAPLWLDEGLAMYIEGPLDRQERRLLDAAKRTDGLLSVRSLTSFPGQADLVPLAYAQSRDIVAFLVERHGATRFRTFVDRLGAGRDGVDEALGAVYGYDQLSLYQAYRSARGLPPAATPGPGERRPSRRAPAAPSGGLCGAVALLLPAAAVARHRSRHRGATAATGTAGPP